jgi:hypothetical protein
MTKDKKQLVMETEKQTCADLVEQKMWDRSADLERINDIIGDDDSSDDDVENALSELNDYALEISSFRVIKILLSTGGPGDWLELKVDNDGDVCGLTYHYQDWFDHAQIKVPANSYLWDYALQIADTEG